MPRDRFLFSLSCIATVLALLVVVLGAYTRLKDAGLGCPDWPGCYGHWTVPQTPTALAKASQLFAGQTVEPTKAWPEMVHRYVAGTLGLLIFTILGRSIFNYRKYRAQTIGPIKKIKHGDQPPLGLPILLSFIVLIQAALGRWTVTLKLLPPVVMFHLLGGLTLLALLSLLSFRLGGFFQSVKPIDARRFRVWTFIGLCLLIGQIVLGGWTSSNYAALVCPHFPYCEGRLIPPMNFSHAFTIFDKIGRNYQGGVLDEATRITIQFTHRIGAAVVGLYWFILAMCFIAKAQSRLLLRFTVFILGLLIAQIVLGFMNIVYMLPVHVAVSHNAVAALLLVTLVALNYAVFSVRKHEYE
jgi:heme a synthase